jgi:hypothetical protein
MPSGSLETKVETREEVFVGLANVPESIRRLADLADADYADTFTVQTDRAAEKSAEQWARALLEESALGRKAPILWTLLGLRLGPRPSVDHVQGWKIAERGEGWIRVETSSWCLTTHAVMRSDDGKVSLALFVRFDKPAAAAIWAPVAPLHRKGAPMMVREAVLSYESPAIG